MDWVVNLPSYNKYFSENDETQENKVLSFLCPIIFVVRKFDVFD